VIAPQTRMGAVELAVADLHRSLSFYEHAIGLRVHRREQQEAALGVGGEDLLRLVELDGARPARGFSGLYHFALLLPQRTDLARWLAHAVREQITLAGLSDHFVSEAIYLSDPDEHGIEIYWDRPRELWEGQVAERMTTQPLDAHDLLGTLHASAGAPFERLPAGTTIGHVHLRVGDVTRVLRFYRDVLGFDLVASYGAQAAFLSAGGYHHHVGLNSWESAGRDQAPDGYATLLRASVLLPDYAEVVRAGEMAAAAGLQPASVSGAVEVTDPSGNRLLLSASGAQTAER
jgi:catechol 2,3-dioxygenase